MDFEKGQIEELLTFFDPSVRDEWVDVFRALGNKFKDDHEVFSQCVSWASKSDKHDAAAAKHEKNLFYKDNNDIGVGVLIKKAQERGYFMRPATTNNKTKVAEDAVVELKSSEATEMTLYDSIKTLSSLIISNLVMYCTPENRSDFLSKYKDSFVKAPVEHVGIFEALMQHTKSHSTFILKEFYQTLHKYNVSDAFFKEVSNKDPVTYETLCEHMEQMIDKASRLQLINLARECIMVANHGPMEELKNKVNKAVMCLGSNNKIKMLKGRTDVLHSCNEALAELSDPDMLNKLYITTGYKVIDNQVYGYRRGEVSILAAHTGVGKTYFGIETALKAIDNNQRVLFFTAEMSVKSIAQRCFMVKMKMSEKTIQENGFPYKAFEEYKNVYDVNDNLDIIGGRSLSIEDIKASVDRAKFVGNVDLIIIDYLQIIENDRMKKGEQWEIISDVMRQLVALAQDSDTAILVLTQLTKPQYEKGKKKKEPTLYDIAGSSGVVRDVALALILFKDDESSNFKLVVAKSRYASSSQRFELARTSGGGFRVISGGYSTHIDSDVTKIGTSIAPPESNINITEDKVDVSADATDTVKEGKGKKKKSKYNNYREPAKNPERKHRTLEEMGLKLVTMIGDDDL